MADVPWAKKEEKALTPKENVAISVEAIKPLIEKDSDFVIFRGRNGKQNVEPTRDLALKLITNFNLSYDTNIEEAGDKRFIVKAVVWDEKNHKASGLGLCTFDEVKYSHERQEHDALTKAETRAIKRAIEALAGQAVINRLILEVFGAYELDDEPRDVTPTKKQAPPKATSDDLTQIQKDFLVEIEKLAANSAQRLSEEKFYEKYKDDERQLKPKLKFLRSITKMQETGERAAEREAIQQELTGGAG